MKTKFKILSKAQSVNIKGGLPTRPIVSSPKACACCICSPEVKGAGSVTARVSG